MIEESDRRKLLAVATRSLISNYARSLPTMAQQRSDWGWNLQHEKNLLSVRISHAKIVLIGDSIVNGLSRYSNVWKYFTEIDTLNLGMKGDRVQHVLWRLQRSELPKSTKTLVILVGTNNLLIDKPREISDGVASIAKVALELVPGIKVVVCGLLLREMSAKSLKRQACYEVNKHIKFLCKSGNLKGLFYVKPAEKWVLPNDNLNTQLYFKDYLHLNEQGNLLLANSILSTIKKATCGRKKKVTQNFFANYFLIITPKVMVVGHVLIVSISQV